MPDTPTKSSLGASIVKFCVKRPFSATLLYIILVSTVFLTFPHLDIWITSQFYSPGEPRFPATQDQFLRKVRYLNMYLIYWVVGLSLLVMGLKLAMPQRKPIMDLRGPIFLIATLIIGPGLVTNLFFKDQWGRPRPAKTDIFGGDLPFVGIWQPSNYCPRNCSFVSGEGSSAFWYFALVFLAPKSWRKPMIIIIGTLCIAFSINRVAFGGHYASDTLLSWGVTMLVILAVYKFLFERTPAWAKPDALDENFTKAGIWLNAKLGRAWHWCAVKVVSFLHQFRK